MGYGLGSRLFHWLTVLLLLVMIPSGIVMVQQIPRPLQDGLFVLHKGLGSLFLVLILLRLAWRAGHPPPPLPASVPPWQRRAAAWVHAGLYLLLLVVAVSGYVRVTMGGFPIEWLQGLGIPPLLPVDKPLGEAAGRVHFWAKLPLFALILAHIGAAGYHGLVRRDGVVSRMWPPFG